MAALKFKLFILYHFAFTNIYNKGKKKKRSYASLTKVLHFSIYFPEKNLSLYSAATVPETLCMRKTMRTHMYICTPS